MRARPTRSPADLLRLTACILALGLSQHAAGFDAIFADGFDERACAWSGAVPPEGSTCGAGHLVLIGHDYFQQVVARNDLAPQGVIPPPPDLDSLLINAVAQSPAAHLPRAIRIAVLDVNTESGELSHVLGILTGALAVQTETIQLDAIPASLTNSDVLLIPDQNGFFADQGAPTVAAQLAPSLRAFLQAGGVVVVLDGTFVAGDFTVPSETFRILDPQLLAVELAQTFQGCAVVPCNESDPLLAGTGAADICDPSHAVAFVTDEPWITYAHLDPDNPDLAFVLHRWFGTAQQGPIAFDLDLADGATVDLSAYPVFFQQADGQQVARCFTLDNGTAVHQMAANGFVSIGMQSAMQSLVTVVEPEPLDHLRLALPQLVDIHPFQVEVDLPGTVPGASSYRALLGCGSNVSGTPTLLVTMPDTCFNFDGSYNLVGEALDAGGELLAYTMLNGVNAPGGSQINMPPWKAPDFYPATTGLIPPGFESIALSIDLSADGIDYREGGGDVLRANPGGTFSFYSDPGPGAPQFKLLTHREQLRYDSNGEPFAVTTERAVRGPLISTLALDLGNDYLPRLSSASLFFDGNQRMEVEWSLTAGSTAGIDGATVTTAWTKDAILHQWTIVSGPGTGLVAPPDPGDLGDLYWPGPGDPVGLTQLQLDDSSFLPSYLAYRQEILGVTRPPSSEYTLRSTKLTATPIARRSKRERD